MPHKHVRKRAQDPSLFDLPPSQIARPLPVHPNSQPAAASTSKKRKRGRNGVVDDAPREFKRLMAFASGKKFKSGLDGGVDEKSTKKGGKQDGSGDGTTAPEAAASATAAKAEIPTIRPGERMSDFAARVDAAIPITGLKRGGRDPLGLKAFRTRKEKKMHKLYEQWRQEERKIQERREEELELAAELELEKEEQGRPASFAFLDEGEPKEKGKGRKKKKGGKRGGGGRGGEEEDPWLEIKRLRAEGKVGLHDVAVAPPELHKGNSARKLTVQGAAVDVGSVPKAAGSLRRREQLNEVRHEVVAAYRGLMNKRRPRTGN